MKKRIDDKIDSTAARAAKTLGYDELVDIADQMTAGELYIADEVYKRAQKLDIRNLGQYGMLELSLKLARWLYPRICTGPAKPADHLDSDTGTMPTDRR